MTTELDGAQAPEAAGDSATESTATAAVENVEAAEPAAEAAETTKTFTQEEMDEIVAKRLARAQRKWEREQQAKVQPAESAEPTTTLKLEQFESPEAYAEALAEQKAAELVQKREASRRESEAKSAYFDREELAREKYDDYEQVARNPQLPVTTAMAEAIVASDIGPDLLYHLGQNPQEAARIAQLTPLLQAREIGRLEAKLAEAPPTKRVTSAPAPISPVNTRGGAPAVIDTSDPRSIKTMSTAEWIEAENRREQKKWEAAHR